MTREPGRPRDNRVVQGIALAGSFLFLLSLGTWQMERLRWKEGLLADIAARAGEEAVEVPLSASNLPEYTHIFADGVFRHDLEMLLIPRTRAGVPGAHVLTPLERAGAPAVLVNRGFVPAEFEPTVTRRISNPTGTVRIEGLLRIEHPPGPFVPDNHPATGVWYSIDLAAMAAATGLELAGYVLEVGLDANPGGWPEGGQTIVSIRNTHLEYALTWYGLAAVLAVCMSVLARREWTGPGRPKHGSSA